MVDFNILMILVFLILLISTISLFFYVSGVLQSITVNTVENVPFIKNGATFFYKCYTGSYKSIGGLFTEAYSIAPDDIKCAIYYDDPNKVEDAECRAAVGVLLDESSDQAEILKKNLFQNFQIPLTKEAIYANFPHISFLSVFIGAYKAYPAIEQYAKDLNSNVIAIFEIYDDQFIHYIGITGDTTDYLVKEFRTEDTVAVTSEDDVDEETDDASFEKVNLSEVGEICEAEPEIENISPREIE